MIIAKTKQNQMRKLNCLKLKDEDELSTGRGDMFEISS